MVDPTVKWREERRQDRPSCSLVRRVLKQGSEMIWQKSSSSMFSWAACMSV